MTARLCAALLLAALLLAGGKKPLATARGENEDLVLNVTLYTTPADVKELIGSDLGGHYIVAAAKVEPKYGKDIVIDRDDFLLRTDKDGEKARPYSASQVAGQGALVIRQTKGEGAASPGWTGTGGAVILGGGGGGLGGGSSSVDTSGTAATVEKGTDKPNPLKKTLDDKILPEGKTSEPVSGLLYFAMEKQKVKDLELTYGGKDNRITMRFK